MNIIEFLKHLNINPNEYLKIARAKGAALGYDPSKIEFSDKEKHKLMYNSNIYFGANYYKDFIIYTLLAKQNKITHEYALSRRRNYLERSGKIKGEWPLDKYSKNNLARKILW